MQRTYTGIDVSRLSLTALLDREEAPQVGQRLYCTCYNRQVELVDWNSAGHPTALVKWTDDNGTHRQSIPKVYLKPINDTDHGK